MFDREMQDALIADGEKLTALTGEDHGPIFPTDPRAAFLEALKNYVWATRQYLTDNDSRMEYFLAENALDAAVYSFDGEES